LVEENVLRNLPIIGALVRQIGLIRFRLRFRNSAIYWQSRYATGGTSGSGSYNRLAEFKAEVLNALVESEQLASVIEFGCGDGNQLSLANYPTYLGFDISPHALALCRERFAADSSKRFGLMQNYIDEQAELALSLDVIYHLVEEVVFEDYMRRLFAAATRFVVIYASNTDTNPVPRPPHLRHRCFTQWVELNLNDWELQGHIPNRYPPGCDDLHEQQSFADFYIYRRVAA
jgi:hypothetical protein